MSVIATALKHMLAAGMDPEAIVAAVAEMEREMAPDVDRAAEKRREWDRERKRKQRNSALSGGSPVETGGNQVDVGALSSPEVSPHTPFLTPPILYPLRPLKGALPPRRSTRSSPRFRKWPVSPGFPCRGPSRHLAVARCCCGSRNTACRRSSMPSSASAAAVSAVAKTTAAGAPTSISSASRRASSRSSKANTTTGRCSNRNRRPGRKARPCNAITTSTQG